MFVVRHARTEHCRGSSSQHCTDGVAKRRQNGFVLVATSPSGCPCDLTKDLGGVLVFAPPARPNEGRVDDPLKAQVFKMVAIMINFANTHGLATIFTCMEGVWGSDTDVERGREGRDNCNCKDVSRA